VGFSAVANTSVRLLTLDREFFMDNPNNIPNLDLAVLRAYDKINKKGIPENDFKEYDPMRQAIRNQMRLMKEGL
jgi:hypothetical protein